MLVCGRRSRLLVSLALPLLGWSSAAVAVEAQAAQQPAQVSVRVVGATPAFSPLLPPTLLTTTTAPVVKDGGNCSGTSAAGALEIATKGNWEGHWNSGFSDYEVISIEGQAYPFEPGSSKNYYWSLWLDGKETSTGICGTQLTTGDEVLFLPGCFGAECPPAPAVLVIEAPPIAEVGAPVTVRVVSHPGSGGEPQALPGAMISGGGIIGTADSSGRTTVTFSHAGSYVLRGEDAAKGPPSVPAEALICVHAGNDGNCGTAVATGPGFGSGAGGEGVSKGTSIYSGPYAVVAKATSVINGHLYRRGRAPRVLAGTVTAHTAVSSVSLELRRRFRGHCSDYDGVIEQFVAARCGRGRFFKVSTSSSFSYLLPAALAPGRYVLDIEATDVAGNRTSLARGTSRIVFYVR
jgi:hypothetical protein